MTRVLSLRLPAILERAIRNDAARCNKPVSNIVRLILEHSVGGHYSFSKLQDVQEFLDAKLDVRLPQELVLKLHAESERLQTSVSVYSRIILYAYYTKKLVFIKVGDDRYTLAENHDQTKSA